MEVEISLDELTIICEAIDDTALFFVTTFADERLSSRITSLHEQLRIIYSEIGDLVKKINAFDIIDPENYEDRLKEMESIGEEQLCLLQKASELQENLFVCYENQKVVRKVLNRFPSEMRDKKV